MKKTKNNSLALDEEYFSSFKKSKSYKKNQIIIMPGGEPEGIYYLKSGFVRLYLLSKDGKELTFNIYKPGSFFPMIWALTKTPNIYFFESLTRAQVLIAPKDAIVERIQENPQLLYTLTIRTLKGLDGLTRLMDALLSNKNAYHKVASILTMLIMRFGKRTKNKAVITIPLTHRVIGSLAGLSREATSRELERLTKEKIIYQNNHRITIKNIKKLEEESLITFTANIIY